eukprot:364712-Chlamydomonas_euryale.AAC.3
MRAELALVAATGGTANALACAEVDNARGSVAALRGRLAAAAKLEARLRGEIEPALAARAAANARAADLLKQACRTAGALHRPRGAGGRGGTRQGGNRHAARQGRCTARGERGDGEGRQQER